MGCVKVSKYGSSTVVVILLILYSKTVTARAPAQMGAPMVTSVTFSTIEISFVPLDGYNEYRVNAKPRYGSLSVRLRVTDTTTAVIGNLTSSTIYDLTVQAVNSTGDEGIPGNVTTQQTHPGVPIIRSSTPLPTTFLLFLETANRARISQWTVEYRIEGNALSNVKKTPGGLYYVLRLLGLQPDTTYEVRARASQIYGNIDLQENETLFSDWYKFKTDSLSVFGRVTLIGQNFTNTTKWSMEWNDSLRIITEAYSDLANLNSIDLVQLEEGTGIVYYEIKVTDKAFTDTTTSTYLLSGSEFDDSFVNNGDQTNGNATLTQDEFKDWIFQYDTNSNTTEDVITKTYMLVSPEEMPTQAILVRPVGDVGLSNAQGERTMSFRDDVGRFSFADGKLSDDSYPSNTVIGFEPRYLIRDYLKEPPRPLLYALYYEMSQPEEFRFIRTTDLFSFDLSTVSYSTSSDGSAVTISFPSIDKSTQFEINVNGNNAAMLHEKNIDGSPRLTMTVTSLSANTTYEFTMTTSLKKHDDTVMNVMSSAFNVSTHTDQCSACSKDAICEIAVVSEETTCHCKDGFEGDGTVCIIPVPPTTSTTVTPEPTPPPPPTNPPETSTQSSTQTTTDQTTVRNTNAFTTTPNAPTTTVTTTTAPTITTTTTAVATTTADVTTVMTSTSTTLYDCDVQSDVSFVPQRPSLSNTNFTITWNNVSSMYTVVTRCIESACNEDIQNNSTTMPIITLIGLNSGAAYNICVEAEVCEFQEYRNKTQCNSFVTNPSSVGNVSIVPGMSSVNISWEAVPGALTYSVSLASSGTPELGRNLNDQVKNNISGTSVIFTHLFSCQSFSVELIALNRGGASVPTRTSFTTFCSTTGPSISTIGDTTPNLPLATTAANDTASITTVKTTLQSLTSTASLHDGSTTISMPHISAGPPWWFILAIVLAFIIIISCTYGVVRVSTDKNLDGKAVRLLAIRERRDSQSIRRPPTPDEPERTRV